MPIAQKPKTLKLHTQLRDFSVQIIEPTLLVSWSFNDRIEYLAEQMRSGNIVIISDGIDSIFFGVNEYRTFDAPSSKLRLLVYSLPECCGCFLGESELAKLNILGKQGLVISPIETFYYIAEVYKLSLDSLDVVTSGGEKWRRDITDIRGILQLKKAVERAPDPPVQLKESQILVTLYEPEDDEASVVLKDALGRNQYLQWQFSMLYRLVGSIEGIKRGKLVYKGPASEKQRKIEELLSLKEEIEHAIDDIVREEKKHHLDYGNKVGTHIGRFHSMNSLYGDLHRGNIICPAKNPGGIAFIDLEDATLLLRELDAIECAGDIVTLFIELSSVEWRAFKEAYMKERGEKGREVIDILETEWNFLP